MEKRGQNHPHCQKDKDYARIQAMSSAYDLILFDLTLFSDCGMMFFAEMQKGSAHMRNRNLLVLAIAAILILLVAALSMLPQAKREVEAGATLVPDVTATVSPTAEPVQPTAEPTTEPTAEPAGEPAPEPTFVPADAYLLVTVRGIVYEPIPLTEEAEYTIRQGEEMENTIHVTADSIFMKHSTCDNQDCVLQGTVTLENMTQRVLGNMIICLPNEVTLELHTPETLEQLISGF